MDREYDMAGAERRLEVLALDRYNSTHSGTQLSRITSVSAHYEAVSAGRIWNLVHRNTNEELVASFQGIIVKQDLPPFTDKLGQSSSHIRYLRQSVSIVGLDSPTFAKVVSATANIHAVLGRAVGLANLLDCGMVATVNGSICAIELSNRYFRSRQDTSADEVALSPSIDPHGYLAVAAASHGLYHSEDNVVEYFERVATDDGEYKYNETKPSIFEVGDIVEVQASFALFPLRDGKYKSSMILRGLTLLDGSFTQARVKNMIVLNAVPPIRQTVKRRVGYNEEQLSVTRAKLSKMTIADASLAASVNTEKSEESGAEEVAVELLKRSEVQLD